MTRPFFKWAGCKLVLPFLAGVVFYLLVIRPLWH